MSCTRCEQLEQAAARVLRAARSLGWVVPLNGLVLWTSEAQVNELSRELKSLSALGIPVLIHEPAWAEGAD